MPQLLLDTVGWIFLRLRLILQKMQAMKICYSKALLLSQWCKVLLYPNILLQAFHHTIFIINDSKWPALDE